MENNYKRRLAERRYRIGNHILEYLETEIDKMAAAGEKSDRFHFGVMEKLIDILIEWPMISPRTAVELKAAYFRGRTGTPTYRRSDS